MIHKSPLFIFMHVWEWLFSIVLKDVKINFVIIICYFLEYLKLLIIGNQTLPIGINLNNIINKCKRHHDYWGRLCSGISILIFISIIAIILIYDHSYGAIMLCVSMLIMVLVVFYLHIITRYIKSVLIDLIAKIKENYADIPALFWVGVKHCRQYVPSIPNLVVLSREEFFYIKNTLLLISRKAVKIIVEIQILYSAIKFAMKEKKAQEIKN